MVVGVNKTCHLQLKLLTNILSVCKYNLEISLDHQYPTPQHSLVRSISVPRSDPYTETVFRFDPH